MTAKEKAEELVRKYTELLYNNLLTFRQYEDCKQCALIAVNEIIGDIDDSILHPQNKEAIDYWQEVKKELESL